jgi:tRNA G18 (ribose-2'-O)-methylase SpoU
MPTVIPITSLAADPRLAPYANQRDAHLRAPHLNPDAEPSTRGSFIAEGELVVRTLLHSIYPTRSLLVREAYLPKILPDVEASEARASSTITVFTASQETLDQIVGFHIHRGVLACAERPAPPLSLDEVLTNARTLILLEDLSNHDNVGGIFRNAGCLTQPERTAIVLSPRSCDPLYRKSLRVSMGHVLRVPFVQPPDWDAALQAVTSAGFTLAAMETGPSAVDIGSVQWPQRTALVLGSEGPGLRPVTLARCALRVLIPMSTGADSLNVAGACGIALSWMRLV